MRSRQAALNQTLTEMRIEELESQLKELKIAVDGLPEDWEPPLKRKYPINLHETHRVGPEQFHMTRSKTKQPPETLPALEVLESENSSMVSGRTGEDQHGGPSPERLRIRSRPLLVHLDKLTSSIPMNFSEQEQLDGTVVYSSVLFLRPFKYFVKNHRPIRESIVDVEARIQADVSAKLTSASNLGQRSNPQRKALFEDADLLEDLKLLIDFIDNNLKPTLNLREQLKDGTAKEIEYGDLWHLFERGDIVVPKTEQNHAYRVVNFAGGRELLSYKIDAEKKETQAPLDGFIVDCINLSYDGSSYVPKLTKVTIKKFYGSQPITSLPIYPLKFAHNSETLRETFTENGKRFIDLTDKAYCHKLFRGKTLDEPPHEMEAQVIVDTTLAIVENPKWRLDSSIPIDDFTKMDRRETTAEPWCGHGAETCCGGDFVYKDGVIDEAKSQDFLREMSWTLGPLQAEDLGKDDLMLMQHYVHAFGLRSRQWITVLSKDLSDVKFANSFDDLVLPGKHGPTVRALVDNHEALRATQSAKSPSPTRRSVGSCLDLVQGKGAGLIILLHGPPGVGKTSTAECVADDTQRPLYPITCGDIGDTALEVEKNLQHNFQLAHKWGCVLLLDEADVFLAKRSKSDLRHNAVTSVFLRSLEYYAGILFLTTNRVGTMDPAFKSRIQLCLFYPKLELDVTKKLYKMFIKRAKEEQAERGSRDFVINKSEIMEFAKENFRDLSSKKRDTWNGRQIRNAFQTAIALTEHEGKSRKPEDPLPVLGKEQFRTVASGFDKFDEYLIATVGRSESDEARRDSWRNDHYMTMPPYSQMPAMPAPISMQRSMYPGQQPQVTVPTAAGVDSDTDDSDSETDSDEEKAGKRHGNMKSRTDKSSDLGPTGQQEQMVTLTIEQLESMLKSREGQGKR
ncbi:AAA family ATPase [Colletotrichum karsti]|uniref:AAA family ATPase n=1 Tax=Colletotrichum karsti TaxID=1095194 RepID=A0A9P6LLX4_9PEZI|nr:AAA family ATPase [Colletotrichum karsti]KAF9877007.1 AAA family ATPase [Colletotrichum karsti]